MLYIARGIPVCVALLLTGQPVSARPPELSPKVHDLIDRFFAPPEFDQLELSPTGSHVAFLQKIKGRTALATVNLKTGKPALTAPDWKQDITSFDWVGANQLLFSIGQDIYYLGHWLTNADITSMEEIPRLYHAFTVVDPLPQDPTGVLLAQNYGENFFSPLYRYDPTRNKIRVLESNPGRIVRWYADVAGHVLLAIVAEEHEKYSFIYRESEKSAWQPLALPKDADFITFDRSGHHLLISYPDKSDRMVMQSYDLQARQLTDQPIANPTYDISPGVIRDPRTGVACGLYYDEEKLKFIWLDAQVEKLQAQLSPAFPGATVYPLGATQTGEILVEASADVSPTKYFLLDPETGKLRLFLNQFPKVTGLTLSPMVPVAFKSADGVDLHGYLTRPSGRAPGQALPLIALVHGGPTVRDRWGYDAEVQYFASLGYAVLQVNYRGSTGYGKKYELKSIIEVGERSVDDVADGMQWAVDQGIADPRRLVVCGGSYGGYIALGIATRHPALPAGVVGFAGVYDWENETRSDSKKFDELFKWMTDYYPDLKQNAERYRAISPVHQAAAVKAPVLLVHGRKDRRVDIAQSELMARALRTVGKAVEIVKDAEGIHGLPDENLRRTYYERVTAFILKYAPPDQLP